MLPRMATPSRVFLVTGGAGFIGSHVVERVLALGDAAVVVDNFSTGRRENLAHLAGHDRFRLVEANVVDGLWAAVKPAVEHLGPATHLVHLAAQTSVVSSVQNPVDDVRINYGATVHALEYARHNGVQKVVFASSAATYGDETEMPIAEARASAPVSPYGINKLGSELFLHYYRQVHGLPTTALRFFNVYGPRQDPRSPYSGVISVFVDRAVRGLPLTIFGDGTQTRDFVFVEDVVRAILAACEQSGAPGPYNVGTGRPTSITDLAKAIVAATGSASPIQHAPSRAGEIVHSYANVDAARMALGFRAEVALEEGLARTQSSLAPDPSPATSAAS
ncbi:MAG: NAD-dependent epimerase/dehydratase family protein [Myxococcales bacterium FL481]|nr:MAG: NAD-dependent epimerase/dehydratase family protein [Myxococcales bacterium FL481]